MHRFARGGVAAALAGLSGLLFGLATPRGAVTTTAALATMAAGVAIGLLAGYVLRLRWAA
jgi:hypothetical protein